MKKILGALLVCGLLTVPMAQAAKIKAPKVHQGKQAKLAKKESAKARKQAQRRPQRQAKNRKSV